MNNHWFFIINPISGNGKGILLWQKVKLLLDENAINYSFAISTYHKHTIQLVSEKHKEGYRRFIGLGGDGTINEIINALFHSPNNSIDDSSTIALMPVGTGNDWVRNQEVLDLDNLIEKIKQANRLAYDVGLVQAKTPQIHHYFMNVAGAGLDGQVVEEIGKLHELGKKGKLSYIQSMLKALTQFKAPEGIVFINGKEVYSGKTLVLTASKGSFFGGGMHISPNAKSGNGLLDITVVKDDSKWVIFPQLYRLFNGDIASATFVEKYADSLVTFKSSDLFPIQADGEFLGYSNQIQFSVIKHAIFVLQ
jgi:YegS/Rv2252/BmrU family lipid kinase